MIIIMIYYDSLHKMWLQNKSNSIFYLVTRNIEITMISVNRIITNKSDRQPVKILFL